MNLLVPKPVGLAGVRFTLDKLVGKEIMNGYPLRYAVVSSSNCGEQEIRKYDEWACLKQRDDRR